MIRFLGIFVLNFLLMPRNIFIFLILLYRKIVSPLYGNVCRYYPSCSAYALECFQKFNFFLAFIFVLFRVVRCNPFSSGGFDYPQIKKRFYKKNKIVVSKLGFVYIK